MAQSRGLEAVKFVLAFCVVSMINGCSSMPSSGPSREAVIERSAQPDAPFALIEIRDPVLDILGHWPRPSFYGRFGDHRPAIEQKIGVGDSVQITVWEASGGGLFSFRS